jgi:hypothetical protein
MCEWAGELGKTDGEDKVRYIWSARVGNRLLFDYGE